MTRIISPSLLITPAQRTEVGHDSRFEERLTTLNDRLVTLAVRTCLHPATDDDLPSGTTMGKPHLTSPWRGLGPDTSSGSDIRGRLHLAQRLNGGEDHSWVLVEGKLVREQYSRRSAGYEIASFSSYDDIAREERSVRATIGEDDGINLRNFPMLLPLGFDLVEHLERAFPE